MNESPISNPLLRFPLRDSAAVAQETAVLVSAAADMSAVGDFTPAAAADFGGQ